MSYLNNKVVVKSFHTIDGFTIYPVTHNLVDFFWGEGWENHARFKWSKGAWELWEKSSSLPKDFIVALEIYRKGNK